MKIVRLLQTIVIFMMIVFVGVTLLGTTATEELTRAYMFLLAESSVCGLISAIAAILILRAKRVESFSIQLSKLMFISLAAFTIVWGLGTHFAELHYHEDITIMTRLIRVAFGFFGGWFMVILFIFVIQMLFPRKPVEEEYEDDDEEEQEQVKEQEEEKNDNEPTDSDSEMNKEEVQ